MGNLVSLIDASILASMFVFGALFHVEQFRHKRRWISIAAGASVAYVFVHLLPELSVRQAAFAEAARQGVLLAEVHVYVAALIGFVLFFGLDTMAVTSRGDEHEVDRGHRGGNAVAWVHIGAMALNVALISYLLVDWNKSPHSLFVYTLAMAFHFLVYDHALRDEYGGIYSNLGKWVLCASVFLGWAVGVALPLSERVVGVLVGFAAGSVAINGIRDELPRSGEGRFVPFALGAVVFSILLLI